MMQISSPAVMASFGHSGSQTPQLMQSELISNAIFVSFVVCPGAFSARLCEGADDRRLSQSLVGLFLRDKGAC
jgi:hypothetical protein